MIFNLFLSLPVLRIIMQLTFLLRLILMVVIECEAMQQQDPLGLPSDMQESLASMETSLQHMKQLREEAIA